MPVNTFEKTPGPQYFPGDKPNKKTSQKYTFGFRRTQGAQDSLVNKTSTTKSVGPGRYVPEASSNPSTKKDFPKWTLPKAGRSGGLIKKIDKNQTYDTRSSVGKQYVSKNKSGPSAHFGTSVRGKLFLSLLSTIPTFTYFFITAYNSNSKFGSLNFPYGAWAIFSLLFYHILSEKRERTQKSNLVIIIAAKTGTFKDSMTGAMKVRMPHVPY